jgi:hypothetical protein
MHIRELRIAAVLGQLMGIKESRERRLFSVGLVRMPEIARRDDADEFAVNLLIGEDGDFRKARHALILIIQHFEGAKPPAEGNLMLRLNMLIAENQDLPLHENIDNLIEKVFVQLF